MKARLTNLHTGEVVEVIATTASTTSSYGQFVWQDTDGQPYCTVGLEHGTLYQVSNYTFDSEDDLLVLGQAIRNDRIERGLSLRQFAALCGVTAQTIPNLEEGRHAIRADLLIKVLKAIGWTLKVKCSR